MHSIVQTPGHLGHLGCQREADLQAEDQPGPFVKGSTSTQTKLISGLQLLLVEAQNVSYFRKEITRTLLSAETKVL